MTIKRKRVSFFPLAVKYVVISLPGLLFCVPAHSAPQQFNFYIKKDNTDRKCIGTIKTDIIKKENATDKKQTRTTNIQTVIGWRWIPNKGYINYHNYVDIFWNVLDGNDYINDTANIKTTWFESPACHFLPHESITAGAYSLITFTTTGNENIGATSFAFNHTFYLTNTERQNSYTYHMSERLRNTDSLNTDPVSRSNDRDDDEGYHSLPNINDNPMPLKSELRAVNDICFNMIDSYRQNSGMESWGSWSFGLPFGDIHENNPQTIQLFFDIWSLFEHRELIYSFLSQNVYAVFLVTPVLGTNPILLANFDGGDQQENGRRFNLLSSVQRAYGLRDSLGLIEFITDGTSELERIHIEFNTGTNVQIDLERATEAGAVGITLPELRPATATPENPPFLEDDFFCTENLEASSTSSPESEIPITPGVGWFGISPNLHK